MPGLHNAYLTSRQLHVWDLMRNGFSQSEIARKLNITRQAVNQLSGTIPERITSALYDASKLNNVEPRRIDAAKGVLVGWSKDFETEVVITVHPDLGLRTWYKHNLGKCSICRNKQECKSVLLKTAENLGVTLTSQEKKFDPSKLSSLVFTRLLS